MTTLRVTLLLLLASAALAGPRRWSLELPSSPEVLAWSGFDPARHTPNFCNDQDVRWTAGPTVHRYRGGLCWGICELAHLYFREFATHAPPAGALREAFDRGLFADLPLPATARGAGLRLLCELSRPWREHVCAVAAALQLDAPEDAKLTARDPGTFVDQILQAIRTDGSVIVHVQRVNPEQNFHRVSGHNLLAFAAARAYALSGRQRRAVIAIRCWDPVFAFPSRTRAASGAELVADRGLRENPQVVLLYDPQRRLLTFTADYLQRKAYHHPDTAAIQPLEALVPGRDVFLRWPTSSMGAAILTAVAGTTKQTSVDSDGWPHRAMLMPAE